MVMAAVAMATAHVGVKRTIAMTKGMRTAAVATRFQVIEREVLWVRSGRVDCTIGTSTDYRQEG